MLTKELDLLASNINDSLTQAALHLPFTCMEQFWTQVMFFSHETLRSRHYSLKQQTQFTILNNVLDPLDSNFKDFLSGATILLHSLERGYFAQSWCSSPTKMLRDRQYSLKQQTHFKMFNNVLDHLISTINDSLTQATLPFPFTCMLWFCKQGIILTHEHNER
jgi:hypothetical protein